MSKYGVFSGPYIPVFGLNTEVYGFTPYLDTFHAVQVNNKNKAKLQAQLHAAKSE